MDRNSGCRGLEGLEVGLGLLVHRGEDVAAGEHSNHFELGVFVTSYCLVRAILELTSQPYPS
jgi:hypothetical protein